MTGLIGSTWKRCKAWSGRVLIAEGLTSKFFLSVG
jgi:hypothetical protein